MSSTSSQPTGNRPKANGHQVETILDDLDALARSDETLRVHHITERFAGRSYGPFLLIPALLEISPVGAIPTVPTLLAAFIAIVAVQMVMGIMHLSLPGFISCRTVPRRRVRQARDKLHGLARFLDRHFHGRMKHWIDQPMPRVAGTVVLGLCLMVPPLEFLPFASMVPMLAIAAIGLALLVRDGLLMIVSLALSGAAVGAVAFLLSSLVHTLPALIG